MTPIRCGRLGPVLKVCAQDLADTWGLEEIPVCGKCDSPVAVGSLRLEKVRAGAELICDICDGRQVVAYRRDLPDVDRWERK